MALMFPVRLEKRLGRLDVRKISGMTEDDLAKTISMKPNLHRYPKRMAHFLMEDCKMLMDKYGGKAEAIWSDEPTAVELERRFREFAGIGQKKGSMAVNILLRDYGIPVKDKEGIDISFDIQVRKSCCEQVWWKGTVRKI